MSSYKPIRITGLETGLVTEKQEFLLPADGFPVLEEAYVWRDTIRRKPGTDLVGRLRRVLPSVSHFDTGASPWTFNLLSVSGYVSNVAPGAPNTITTPYPHGLTTGDSVVFSGLVGSVQLNGNTYSVNVTGTTTFTVVQAGVAAYTSGGFWYSDGSLNTREPSASVEQNSVKLTSGGTLILTAGSVSSISIIGTTLTVTTTAAHGLATGDSVTFHSVRGTTQVNENTYVITVTGGSTFQVTQAGASAYYGGGTWIGTGAGYTAVINYATGDVTITGTGAGGASTTLGYNYFPGLPVMGIREKETSNINSEQQIFFDTRYAYKYVSGNFQEYIPGTWWTGNDDDFFWSTNYWTIATGKLFWVSNFSGNTGDPIRYTDGSTWTDFTPGTNGTLSVAPTELMYQALILLPFRGRLLALNTWEGTAAGGISASTHYPQRIRWSAIGNPIPGTPDVEWSDVVPGKGGWLEIPTSEHIIAAGFVRDNLVIYCERSTWQLRHTGLSVAPFQIEKVNTELGAEGTYSAVGFDKSLVGIGNKGIVECDSYESSRIDVKIPDFVFEINNLNSGPQRVHGIRYQYKRLCFWVYPEALNSQRYPNKMLIYNYENQSWATATNSFTCFGEFQYSSSPTWGETHQTWGSYHHQWSERDTDFPWICTGNQQGFIHTLDDDKNDNDESLTINAITGGASALIVTAVNHNLASGQIILISGIPVGTGYTELNNGVYSVGRIDKDRFRLYRYNSFTETFDISVVLPAATYVGGGLITVRDNIRIVSKKFDHLDIAQKIQTGWLDVLMPTTASGALLLNVYTDYFGTATQSFVVSTAQTAYTLPSQKKMWHRVFCTNRGNFIQLEWKLSNLQMTQSEQQSLIEIDALILYERPAGRITI